MTSSHDRHSLELAGNELANVLAALRHWQERLRLDPRLPEAFPQFDDFEPLSEPEIDRLCERLNSTTDPCDCERPGYFQSGVPGIIAHMEKGRLASGAAVERCDLCQRFATNEAARRRLIELGLA